MLQFQVIGALGADAAFSSSNGREFLTFNVAHNDSYTDSQGVKHDNVVWVSCIWHVSKDSAVVRWLKKGRLVYVSGRGSVRCYSSPKLRSFVAGCNLVVERLELVGSYDSMPSVLYDGGENVQVQRLHWCPSRKSCDLYDSDGVAYRVDDLGFVTETAAASVDNGDSSEVK